MAVSNVSVSPTPLRKTHVAGVNMSLTFKGKGEIEYKRCLYK